MKNDFKKRVAALLCAAALLVMMVPIASAAAPTISVSSATVTQGGTCTVTVTGTQLSALTSLKLTIAYDASAFAVMETAVRTMDIATADSKTQIGFIEYSGISVDGISGTKELLSITFRAEANAPVGSYPVALFCGGATAGQDGEDQDISISVVAGMLTVAESGEVYFNLYPDQSTIESGNEVTLTISSWWVNNLAGGKFTFLYDRNLFDYQSLELLSAMTEAKPVYSINDANEGRILLSFAAEEAIRTGELMRITLKAKQNVSDVAQITLETAELVDVNATPMTAPVTSTYVTISEKASIWLELPEAMNTHESFAVEFWVGGTGGLAAGDFSVSYDVEQLECLGVTGASASNSYLVIDDRWDDGSIEFSVMIPQGIARDTHYLTIEFCARQQIETNFTLTPAATTTPVNRYGTAIVLEYVEASGVVDVSDHVCVNGYCTVCERDVASVLIAGNAVSVVVPGVESGAKVFVALYNEAGKLLGCQMKESDFDLPLVCSVQNMPSEVEVRVFVFDGNLSLLRNPIQ